MNSFFTTADLYEVESKYAQLFAELQKSDEGSYDLSKEDIEQKLNEQKTEEVDELAQNVINHLNNKVAAIAAYKAELERVKERINKRVQIIENEVSRFDSVLAHILKIKGEKSVHYPNGSITSRKSTSVDVGRKGSDSYEAIAALLPEGFVLEVTETTKVIQTKAIKEAVKKNDGSLPDTFHRLVVDKTTYKTK